MPGEVIDTPWSRSATSFLVRSSRNVRTRCFAAAAMDLKQSGSARQTFRNKRHSSQRKVLCKLARTKKTYRLIVAFARERGIIAQHPAHIHTPHSWHEVSPCNRQSSQCFSEHPNAFFLYRQRPKLERSHGIQNCKRFTKSSYKMCSATPFNRYTNNVLRSTDFTDNGSASAKTDDGIASAKLTTGVKALN